MIYGVGDAAVLRVTDIDSTLTLKMIQRLRLQWAHVDTGLTLEHTVKGVAMPCQ